MANIPKKVRDRLVEGLKTYQPIVEGRKQADINEADTVILVAELLCGLFGYDRFTEITSQFPVKNTRCDLATKVGGQLQMLIEVKAIGHSLKHPQITQAASYAAQEGVGWVVLTTGQIWNAYSVTCQGQVDQELVVSIDILGLDHKTEEHLDQLYLFCKEGWARSAIEDFKVHRAALDPYVIGATILSDRILDKIRTELRRVSRDVQIDVEDIRRVVETDVIKRELLEGERAAEAKKTVAKAANVALREASHDG